MNDSEDWVRQGLQRAGEEVGTLGGSATVDRVLARHRRQRRAQAAWLGIAVAVALAASIPAAVGAARTAPENADGAIAATGSASMTGDATQPSTSSASRDPGGDIRSGPARAEIGVAYPFDLYTHCGIRAARFANRDWTAVHPAQDPQRLPNSAGITAYTGYVAGTMTLVRPDLLHFTITDAQVAGAAKAFDFVPAPGPPPPCA